MQISSMMQQDIAHQQMKKEVDMEMQSSMSQNQYEMPLSKDGLRNNSMDDHNSMKINRIEEEAPSPTRGKRTKIT